MKKTGVLLLLAVAAGCGGYWLGRRQAVCVETEAIEESAEALVSGETRVSDTGTAAGGTAAVAVKRAVSSVPKKGKYSTRRIYELVDGENG